MDRMARHRHLNKDLRGRRRCTLKGRDLLVGLFRGILPFLGGLCENGVYGMCGCSGHQLF